MKLDADDVLTTLTSPEGKSDPYPLYAALHETGEAMDLGPDHVLVFGYDAVNSVLRDPGFRVSHAGFPDRTRPDWWDGPAFVQVEDWLLNVDAPVHTRIRSLIARAFTRRRIASLEPAITAMVDELLDVMASRGADGSAVEFMHDFAYRLPVTVICELIGIPEADRELFRPLTRDLCGAFDVMAGVSEPTAQSLRTINAAAAELLAYFTHLAEQRRADPHDDLVSDLLAVSDSDGGKLTSAELLHNLALLLLGGFETTTNLLGNGLHIVLRDPPSGAAIKDGLTPAPAFVDEVLRFDSPVQLTQRNGYDTAVGGVPVCSGTDLSILLGAANRDPRRFADPDRFDPMRPDNNPLSFGAGAHFCIGALLARLEGTVAFPRLLSRFPNIAAAGEPVHCGRLVLRGFDELPVTLV